MRLQWSLRARPDRARRGREETLPTSTNNTAPPFGGAVFISRYSGGRVELIAVVNERPVDVQSRDLSEAAAEGSTLPTSTNIETSFVYQGKRGFCVYFPDGLWYNDPVTEKNRRNV